jgi:hypothetical protein
VDIVQANTTTTALQAPHIQKHELEREEILIEKVKKGNISS